VDGVDTGVSVEQGRSATQTQTANMQIAVNSTQEDVNQVGRETQTQNSQVQSQSQVSEATTDAAANDAHATRAALAHQRTPGVVEIAVQAPPEDTPVQADTLKSPVLQGSTGSSIAQSESETPEGSVRSMASSVSDAANADGERASLGEAVRSDDAEQWSRLASGDYARVSSTDNLEVSTSGDNEMLVIAKDAQASLGAKKYMYNGLPYHLYLIRKRMREASAQPNQVAQVQSHNVDGQQAQSEASSREQLRTEKSERTEQLDLAPKSIVPNVDSSAIVGETASADAAANRMQLMAGARSSVQVVAPEAGSQEIVTPEAVNPVSNEEDSTFDNKVADHTQAPRLIENDNTAVDTKDIKTSADNSAIEQVRAGDSRETEAGMTTNNEPFEQSNDVPDSKVSDDAALVQQRSAASESHHVDTESLPAVNAQDAAASQQAKLQQAKLSPLTDLQYDGEIDSSVGGALPERPSELATEQKAASESHQQDDSQARQSADDDRLNEAFDEIEEGGTFEFSVNEGQQADGLEEFVNPSWRRGASERTESETDDIELGDGMHVNTTLGDVILEGITAEAASRKIVMVDNHRVSAELYRLVSNVETLYYQEALGEGGSTISSTENGVAMQLKEGRFQSLGNATLKLRIVNGNLEVSFDCEQAHGVEFLEQNKDTLLRQLSERFNGNVSVVINGSEAMRAADQAVQQDVLNMAELESGSEDDDDSYEDESRASGETQQVEALRRVVRREGADQEL
jgi:hypothetical protein